MSRNKRAKFVELANNRVNRTLKDIKLIGNLSNRSAYDYTDEDVRKIVRSLQREIDSMRARFSGPGSGGDGDFSL
jgi:galactokinase